MISTFGKRERGLCVMCAYACNCMQAFAPSASKSPPLPLPFLPSSSPLPFIPPHLFLYFLLPSFSPSLRLLFSSSFLLSSPPPPSPSLFLAGTRWHGRDVLWTRWSSRRNNWSKTNRSSTRSFLMTRHSLKTNLTHCRFVLLLLLHSQHVMS